MPADLSGDLVEVTFRPRLDGGLDSKSIGDAGNIDQLRVGVYQVTSKGLVFSEIVTEPWSKVQKEGLSIKLEQLCETMNADIASIRQILQALQDNDYVTGTTTLTEKMESLRP